MQIQNFYMTVREIVPKFDGKFSKDMDADTPSSGIVFNKIGKLGWKFRDFTEAFE